MWSLIITTSVSISNDGFLDKDNFVLILIFSGFSGASGSTPATAVAFAVQGN